MKTNNKEIIKTHSRKTISRPELYNLFKKTEDSELYPIVKELCDDGILVAVKASGVNGNRIYPLYMKYRIITSESENMLDEISILHPLIQGNSFLKNHADKYKKYRNEFQKLDKYLFQSHDLSVPVSKKERSFEIFGEEKMLDNPEFIRILENIGLNKETLSFYDTPEYCFHDYIPDKKDSMTILILENKDIWFNLRKMMFEDSASVLFDTEIDGVLYGEGRKITGVNSLVQYNEFLECSNVRYLYWGDIDREGLNIYCSLLKNSKSCDVELFVPAYEKMLELSLNADVPDSDDHRNKTEDYTNILSVISFEYQNILIKALEDNKRIPQEIINYKCLKENMV